MKRSKFLKAVLIFLAMGFSAASVAQAEEYVEQGRFGVEGQITDDGFHAGVVRETDSYELALDLDGSFIDRSSSSKGVEQTGDMGVDLRAGKRWNIGSYNYLSAGLNYHTNFFGRDAGVSTDGTYCVAPYLGVQRHFSGTNLMLNLYVLPVSYNHSVSNDGNGGTMNVNSYRFLRQGGFGIAYLF